MAATEAEAAAGEQRDGGDDARDRGDVREAERLRVRGAPRCAGARAELPHRHLRLGRPRQMRRPTNNIPSRVDVGVGPAAHPGVRVCSRGTPAPSPTPPTSSAGSVAAASPRLVTQRRRTLAVFQYSSALTHPFCPRLADTNTYTTSYNRILCRTTRFAQDWPIRTRILRRII
eukprot:1192287-Prorocentrum_minimum.AAC.1